MFLFLSRAVCLGALTALLAMIKGRPLDACPDAQGIAYDRKTEAGFLTTFVLSGLRGGAREGGIEPPVFGYQAARNAGRVGLARRRRAGSSNYLHFGRRDLGREAFSSLFCAAAEQKRPPKDGRA